MALPVANQGKTITTDNLYDFASRQHYNFNNDLLGLSEAIVEIAEAVEGLEPGGGGGGSGDSTRAITSNEIITIWNSIYGGA